MKDLSKKKNQELLDLLREKKDALRSMRFSLAASAPGEVTRAGVKKDIARILTQIKIQKESA